MPPKDAEKVVRASTRAMIWADGGPAGVAVIRLYVDDARAILLAGLKEAKRQGWDLPELLDVLSPPKPKKKRDEAWG
jgi:hypothetical protein